MQDLASAARTGDRWRNSSHWQPGCGLTGRAADIGSTTQQVVPFGPLHPVLGSGPTAQDGDELLESHGPTLASGRNGRVVPIEQGCQLFDCVGVQSLLAKDPL